MNRFKKIWKRTVIRADTKTNYEATKGKIKKKWGARRDIDDIK